MILRPVLDEFLKSDDFKKLNAGIESRGHVSIEGTAPSSFPLLISSIFETGNDQILVITEGNHRLQDLAADLSCYIDGSMIFTLPAWETLPYEYVSPPEKTERDRVKALYRMLSGERAVIISTVESLIRKIPAREFLLKKGLALEKDEDYPFDDIVELLVAYGYERAPRVESYGQFAVKGGIIDIFEPSRENPIRLDFFGDTLESIREFDINSQISHGSLGSVTLYPRKELILLKSEKEKIFFALAGAMESGKEFPDELEKQIENGDLDNIRGIEDIFHVAVEGETLLSYGGDRCRIVYVEPRELSAKKDSLIRTFSELYERKSLKTLCLPPGTLLDENAFTTAGEKATVMQVFTSSRDAVNPTIKTIINFQGRIKNVRDEIGRRMADGWRVIVSTGFEGQARRLFDMLSEFGPDGKFEKHDALADFKIIISPLREGVEITGAKIMVLSDHEIFGKSYRRKKEFKRKSSRPIDSFLDLDHGDYVVHVNHGIGIFRGIERMTAGGVERDFLIIE